MTVRSQVLERRYIIEYGLGLWAFGTTQVVTELGTNTMKVCKAVLKASVKNVGGVSGRITQLQKLRHPHVCHITDFLEDQRHYFIIQDRCPGGDLENWMERIDESHWLKEETCAHYVGQALVALNYCHAHSVFHRGLSPSNILLTSKLPDARVRISDFGLALVFDPDNAVAQRNAGPYTPLEFFAQSGQVVNGSADVWSVGAVANALLVGSAPGHRPSMLGPMGDAIWEGRSRDSREFVHWLLQPAGKRPTAAQALQHPWLRGVFMPMDNPQSIGPESFHDVHQRMICYIMAVLLVPTVISGQEFDRIRVGFVHGDTDCDGLISHLAVRDLLLSCTDFRSSHQQVREQEVTAGIEIADVRGTGAMDLCATVCAGVLGYMLHLVAAEEARGRRPGRQKAALQPLPKMLSSFFEVYGSQGMPMVATSELGARLRTSTGLGMEEHAGVDYAAVLAMFSADCDIDSHMLVSTLSYSGGKGTPLSSSFGTKEESDEPKCPDDSAVVRDANIECWEHPVSLVLGSTDMKSVGCWNVGSVLLQGCRGPGQDRAGWL